MSLATATIKSRRARHAKRVRASKFESRAAGAILLLGIAGVAFLIVLQGVLA